MKTLSITLYNRPKYTQILLDHLNNCFGIDEYQIFIYCEPDQPDTIALVENFRTNQTKLTINPNKFGCNKNIYQAIDNGFTLNDYHIHLEDDTIPGRDFLIYCEWANQKYANNEEIFSVSGYVNSDNKIEQYVEKNTLYNSINQRRWFTPWGWATWRNRWLAVRDHLIPVLNNPYVSWDFVLHHLLTNSNTMEIYPMVSRIQNIGAENGSFCPGADWHKNNQHNNYWIESTKNYQHNFIGIEK